MLQDRAGGERRAKILFGCHVGVSSTLYRYEISQLSGQYFFCEKVRSMSSVRSAAVTCGNSRVVLTASLIAQI